MKKFIALVLAACTVLCMPQRSSLAELTSYISDGTYVAYVGGYRTSEYAVRFANGDDSILKADLRAARLLYEEIGAPLGETVEFAGGGAELDGLVDVLRFELVAGGEIEGCYYGYASRLGSGVMLNGREINCQIVVGDGRITVGYPLILGSYHLNT